MSRSNFNPKKFLGLDCSSDLLSLGAVAGEKTIFSLDRVIEKGSSQAPALLDRLLRRHSLSLRDFEAVLVGAGPGSFTGLRIAFSMVKAWHSALGLAVVTRGSFDSIAEQVKGEAEKIAVISDARRNLIYAASYRTEKGRAFKEEAEQLCSLDEFVSGRGEYLFVTYDLHLRDKACALCPGLNFYPQAVWPGIMPLLKQMSLVYNRKKTARLSRLEPLYLYPENCQVRNV